MADPRERAGQPDGEGADEPNLELPSLSLGLGRKKNKKDKPAAQEPAAPAAAEQVERAPEPAPPVAKKAAPPPPRKGTAPPPPPPRKAAPRPAASVPTTPTAPTAPTAPAAPGPPPPAPELVEDPWDDLIDAAPPQPLAPELPTRKSPATVLTDSADEPAGEPVDMPARSRRQRRPARPRRRLDFRQRLADTPELTLPAVPAPVAAVLTGVAGGVLTVLLGWLAARGCDAVRGVGTCGTFGLFALIAILGIEVLLGATLLRAWNVQEPTSTSFFGIGLVAVIAMLFFLDDIDSVWMILVIPLLTAVAFLASWWITATFVEEDDRH